MTGWMPMIALAADVVVGPATHRLMFPPSPDEAVVSVAAFHLDELPVTNADFVAFVAAHPEWRRDRVSRLYADDGYLARWEAPDRPGVRAPADAPVVEVSWFAARAYCRARGARLPTTTEWELAAAASETSRDARRDPAFVAGILAWYAHPTPPVHPPVGQGPPNAWGARDLLGLVWEWTADYDSELVASDARNQGDPDLGLFCGAGTVGASDPADYAAFMRVSMRSALRAADTTNGLGFRCARSLEAP